MAPTCWRTASSSRTPQCSARRPCATSRPCVSLAGDDEPVPIAERPAFQAMLAETDGRRCLARYAILSRELWERAGPLVARLLSQAAAGDADLRAFADTAERQRATGTAMVARHVAERFGLRPGLTVQEAGDVLWTLTPGGARTAGRPPLLEPRPRRGLAGRRPARPR